MSESDIWAIHDCKADQQILVWQGISEIEVRISGGFAGPACARPALATVFPFSVLLSAGSSGKLLGTMVYGMLVNTPRDFLIGEGLG